MYLAFCGLTKLKGPGCVCLWMRSVESSSAGQKRLSPKFVLAVRGGAKRCCGRPHRRKNATCERVGVRGVQKGRFTLAVRAHTRAKRVTIDPWWWVCSAVGEIRARDCVLEAWTRLRCWNSRQVFFSRLSFSCCCERARISCSLARSPQSAHGNGRRRLHLLFSFHLRAKIPPSTSLWQLGIRSHSRAKSVFLKAPDLF